MNNVYHYHRLEKDLHDLTRKFPFVRMNVIGQSVLEKNIYELRIGQGENIIHYNASFHANEWITSQVLMDWLVELLCFYTREHPLWMEIQLSIVPMVNPDGVELVHRGTAVAKGIYEVEKMNNYKPDYCGWKANIRGVDLNKQFPANWEQYRKQTYAEKPFYRDYPGEKPCSEPEAMAMKNLVENNSICRVVALHTQGKEFYWGYGGNEPEEAKQVASELEKVSCYRGIRDVESHAGFRDWFIMQYKRAGFTLELGKGINPLPLSQYAEIYRETVPILSALLTIPIRKEK